MREIASTHKSRLIGIKKQIDNAHRYFKPNISTYNEYRKFFFDTSITDNEQSLLQTLKKPIIEFNVGEMFISRLRGEFSKQEPSIVVMPDDGVQVQEQVIKVVEGHIRHAFSEANSNNTQYDVYTDVLSGGFSVIKVYTEYAHEMSFNQVIRFGRAYDPTLCGFDPLSRYSHKGDGRFCFEFFPLSEEEFQRLYPDVETKGFRYTQTGDQDFTWSYKNTDESIIIVSDFYEKKKKKVKIVRLANQKVMTEKTYKKFLEQWQSSGSIEQPPMIVGKPRETEIETICRYRICENQVLEYEETDFKYLPLVFVDGNSILIRDRDNNAVTQKCRPYLYHAKGAQKLKNFAGQTLAAELENMVMHKFKVAKESIPQEEEYLQAYSNMQIASTFVYNAFMDNDPNQPVPPPQEIQRVPAPPEVAGTFTMMDQLFQTILGSFDAALGIQDNQLSGVAIVEGATQSNAAAMPYIVGFMQAFNQVGKLFVDLIPKYYITPRTIPVVGMDGKRTYQMINDKNNPQSVSFNYDENALNIKIEAGPSFSIQKSRALQQIIGLTKASPLFAQFMATEGLDILLDNIEFKGVEVVKQKADGWMQMMKQQQQKAAQQPNPEQMKMQIEQQKLQVGMQEAQMEMKQHEDQIQLDIMKLQQQDKKLDIDREKVHIEKAHKSMESAHNLHEHHLKREDQKHRHHIEKVEILLDDHHKEKDHALKKESAKTKNVQDGKKD